LALSEGTLFQICLECHKSIQGLEVQLLPEGPSTWLDGVPLIIVQRYIGVAELPLIEDYYRGAIVFADETLGAYVAYVGAAYGSAYGFGGFLPVCSFILPGCVIPPVPRGTLFCAVPLVAFAELG